MQTIMLKNYFIIAWRNLLRNRLYSLVNIAGLAVGMGVSLLIVVHVKSELNYETSIPDHHLIYRVGSTQWAKMSPLLAERLRNEMPGIKAIGRFFAMEPAVIAYEDIQITSEENHFADPSVIDIFQFQFLYGNPEEALKQSRSIVLTKHIADKLFQSNAFPIGETVTIDGHHKYTVTGIMQDLPANTHLRIDCLVSMSSSNIDTNDSRTWRAVSTYALFDSEKAAQNVAENLIAFQYRFLEGIVTPEEIERMGDFYELHPISDIHLHSHREKEMSANSDITYIYIFSALAVLIILIATINFVNLFSTQSIKRAKEIGVRKAIGAHKWQLIKQFLGEAFLMIFIASLLAILLVVLALPWYNQLAPIALGFADLFSVEHLVLFIIVLVLTGLLSGLYPSLHIANYNILKSLKGTHAPARSGITLRKALVGLQFFISLIILIGAGAVYLQMQYIYQKDLGFDKEQVIAIKLHGSLWVKAVRQKESFSNELLQIPGVQAMGTISKMMGERFGYEALQLKGSQEEPVSARFMRADEGFVETMGISIIEGKDFASSADTAIYFIINRQAAQLLNTNQVIGQKAINTASGDQYEGEIVGIVEDFHYASLHQAIEPLVIEYRPYDADYLLVSIASEHMKETIDAIEAKINTLAPGTLFLYQFIDDRLQSLYHLENDLYRVFRIFSFLSVLIACMGLFAIAAHTVETRTKEIGIRKVLGASVSSILLLLSKDYIRLILIASAIAIPVANYFITDWLESFAYKIEISWWMFAVPGLLVLLIALFSVMGQTWKAARANPVESLRNE